MSKLPKMEPYMERRLPDGVEQFLERRPKAFLIDVVAFLCERRLGIEELDRAVNAADRNERVRQADAINDKLDRAGPMSLANRAAVAKLWEEQMAAYTAMSADWDRPLSWYRVSADAKKGARR